MSNKQLAGEVHKQIIRKFEKRKIHSSFIDNILGADLPDIQLISKFNKGISFYYVLLIFLVNTYLLFIWKIKIKEVLQLLVLLKKILDESNCKPNKIWEDEDNKFYNRSMKS